MNLLVVVSLVALGQLEVKDGEKEVRLSLSEGLTLKTGSKQLNWSGAGFTGKVDGGTAFTGIAQTVTHACADGENVDLSGTNNQLALTGRCGEVTVSGLGQSVTVEWAAAISVSGRNNTVTWSKGEPKLTKTGSGHQVLKAAAPSAPKG